MKFSFYQRSILIAIQCCAIAAGATAQETPAHPLDTAAAQATNTDAKYYDAVKAHMLGDDKQSELLLLQVIKEKPAEAAPYYDLSRLAVTQNRADKATEYIRKAIALDGTNKWYREQYGNILAFRNDNETAAIEFSKLAKDESYNQEYLMKSALLYQRAGKSKEALAVLDELLKKNGQDEEILMQQQQIYLKMNDLPSAARIIQQLIDRNPKESRYYALLAEMYDTNKEPQKAAEVYKQMQQRFPNDPTLQLSLASQALKKGDTVQYRAYVHKAITNKELDAETQLGLLVPYFQELNGDSVQMKEALMLIENIVSQHPENAQAISLYGDVFRLMNQPDKAVVQYKRVIELNPSLFLPWQQLLYSYTDRKDADSLIYYSNKAARLFPNQALVHYLNGIGHSNKRAYTDAIRSFNRAIDLQPEDQAELLAEMYNSLADAYNSLKMYAQSDSVFNVALKLNPKNATVLNNYAYYLSVRNERLGDAERMSKQSLIIRPGEGTFLDTYGWILYQEGKFEQARVYIQQAIDANKQNADATLWEHLAAVEFKLGKVDEAVDAWKKAKDKGSDNSKLDKMIAERKLYE